MPFRAYPQGVSLESEETGLIYVTETHTRLILRARALLV